MKVKIKTLAPIHIGSGNLLQNNTDFFTVTAINSGTTFLRVIDDRKILNLIGEENVQNWLLCIERKENIKEFMKIYAPHAKPADYSSRRMTLFGSIGLNDTLKECIHNGMGLPYIPGSSIKGAIRTAVTAMMANRTNGLENKVKGYNNMLSGQALEKILFGADPNQDIFRFLHCGDAYFPIGCEIALRLQMYLNITKRDSLIQKGDIKPQLIEAIGTDVEAEFQMKLNSEYYNIIKRKMPNVVGVMPDEMCSLKSLFSLVNDHTKSLVEREINFWSSQEKSGAEQYVENMRKMLKIINDAIDNNNSEVDGKCCCILRIGHAIGWDFITGGWTRQLKNFDNDVVPVARPNNKRYEEYDFPKSRRLDTDGDYIGFVQLSIV